MAIAALGSTTGLAKQFRQRVLIKNSRRPKKDSQFQQELNLRVQPPMMGGGGMGDMGGMM